MSKGSYSDSKFGHVIRTVGGTFDDIGATGQSADTFSWATKAKIVKFGVICHTPALLWATTTNFTLETESGTDLGTFTPGATGTLGTGEASGNTITATTVAANQVVRGNVTVVGSSGSFYWYVDAHEQYDATS